MKKNGKKKVAAPETRITLLKTPKGSFVYTFKRKPNKTINWEFGISFEPERVKKPRRASSRKKDEPKAESST